MSDNQRFLPLEYIGVSSQFGLLIYTFYFNYDMMQNVVYRPDVGRLQKGRDPQPTNL